MKITIKRRPIVHRPAAHRTDDDDYVTILVKWSDLVAVATTAPDSIHSATQDNRRLVARLGIGPKIVLQTTMARKNALSALLKKHQARPVYFVSRE